MAWYPCGCCRYCQNCADGFGPVQWQLMLDGLANADPPECTECGDLNGTYILEWSEGCAWEYELPTPICGVVKFRLTVIQWSWFPVRWAIDLQLLDADGNTVIFARTIYDVKPDCMTAEGHDLTVYLPAGGDTCSVAAATAHAVALQPCEDGV